MTRTRLCPRCARDNQRMGRRGLCPQCGQADSRHRNTRGYNDPRYQAIRAGIIREHITRWGLWCPGYGTHTDTDHGAGTKAGHAPHAVAHPHDLTIDHIAPISGGGALLDEQNLRVLCRSENSRRAGRPVGGGG